MSEVRCDWEVKLARCRVEKKARRGVEITVELDGFETMIRYWKYGSIQDRDSERFGSAFYERVVFCSRNFQRVLSAMWSNGSTEKSAAGCS